MAAWGVGLAAACTPTFNWRTVALPAGDAAAVFPCRPEQLERSIRLANQQTPMRLMVCEAGGSTFALAELNVSDGSVADAALTDLRAKSTANIEGHEGPSRTWTVKGFARSAERVVVHGRGPKSATVIEHRASLIARTKVYRLSVLGPAPPQEAVDFFFAGFELPAR